MRIEADKEGMVAIKQLCHVALKAGGIDNLNGINRVLSCIVYLNEPQKAPIHDEASTLLTQAALRKALMEKQKTQH